jgi:predicted kinase
MVGLPCSGKTAYARQLAAETNALLLTLDVWHLKLFGDDSGEEHRDEHNERHERVEKIMWDVAKHVLEVGGDVILDYGCWARVERDDYRNRAKSWVQISSCIIWMFLIPNYIAVWKNEIETALKACLKFPKGKWIDTSLFSNRRPETSLYRKLHLSFRFEWHSRNYGRILVTFRSFVR